MSSESQNDVSSEFEEQIKERVYKGPAKRLMEKLLPLSSHVETYQKRWFWELLQNACDYNDDVKVLLVINDENVIFKHNGNAFSMADAMNLIFPDSSKDEEVDEDIIGQFGTGFLSTHILSSFISVSGILKDKNNNNHGFSYDLDRKLKDNRSYLIEKLQKAENQLKTLEEFPDLTKKYSTRFAYKLSEAYDFVDTEETIENGVEFIEKVMPFVFAFVEGLKEVTIKRSGKKYIFTAYHEDDEVITTISQFSNDILETTEEVVIKMESHEGVIVAAQVLNTTVVELPDNLPRLFCAYPIIGSENFPFPCVINAVSFKPMPERNGIELSPNDSENRIIMQNACIAYDKLIKTLSNDGFNGMYNICSVKPGNYTDEIQKWFKTNITDTLKNSLNTTNIIITASLERKPLSEIVIPFVEIESSISNYYNLIKDGQWIIPQFDEFANWTKAINFSMFPDAKLDIEKLLKIFKGNSKSISSYLNENIDVFEWLKRLITLSIETDQKPLLMDYNIIPLQDNSLTSLKGDFYWDNEINEKLKNIFKLIKKEDYRKKLIHPKIDEVGEQLQLLSKNKTEKEISEDIDRAFREYSGNKNDPDFLNALKMLFDWTDKFVDEEELKKYFSWFATQRASLIMDTLASDEKRNMAFKIVQSGKMEVLADLADSSISIEQIENILNYSDEFERFLKWKNSTVDDEEMASKELGLIGEKIVHDYLLKRYAASSYKVVWAANERNEPRYDFEVWKDENIFLYIDAKTTNQGISNANSVPFFMRKSQWDFLPQMQSNQKYYVARVFIGEEVSIKFLKVQFEELT
jgi:hypothetical protein